MQMGLLKTTEKMMIFFVDKFVDVDLLSLVQDLDPSIIFASESSL